MKMDELYEFVERKIGGAFARYGRFVTRHAWKILIMSVIFNGACAVGILNMTSDISVTNVYLPKGVRAIDDQATVEATFPDHSGSQYNVLHNRVIEGFYAAVQVKAKSGSLLSRPKLEAIRALNTKIQAITATSESGSTITYESICARAFDACAVRGSIFWNDEFMAAVDNHTLTYPFFVTSAYGTVVYSTNVGHSLSLDSTGQYLESADYLRFQYPFRTDGDQYEDLAGDWVSAFVDYMDTYSSDEIEVTYAHFESFDIEIDKVVSGDISLFSVTIFLMMAYATLATFTSRVRNQVSQRTFLGFGGLVAAGLAIGASFGICSTIGVDYVSIVGLVPFLIIGIGIDDMFILLSGLSGAQVETSVEDKLAETMRASGVGITITTLTDLIAFLAGAISNFVVVRNFCIYTGVAVIMCYINNITFLAACITINERRVRDNRHFLTCRRIKESDELRKEGKTGCSVICCGGSPPRNRSEAESLLDRFPRWLIPKIVLNLPGKILILLLFATYTAGAIYGCMNIKEGMVFTQSLPDDSYLYTYSTWFEGHFNQESPVAFITTRTYDYTDPGTKDMLDALVTTVQASDFFNDVYEENWFKTYTSSVYYNGASEIGFIAGLQSFINDTAYTSFENDVVINDQGTHITASRIHLLSRPLLNSQEQGEFMLKARELADNSEFDCFAFSSLFMLAEQYVAVLGQSLQTVGIALAAVFVITCIFMPHPILIVFVTVAVVMIMTGVLGYMYYFDIALSAITMLLFIMSVGFSIDFTAHICHGYMISDAKSRDGRVKQAIDKTGSPIFHGAISSLLGIAILAAAKSYVFRTFATVMAFVLIFGIAHALLLLPVLLSWIGPKSRPINAKEDDENPKSNEMNGHCNGGLNMDDERPTTANDNGNTSTGSNFHRNAVAHKDATTEKYTSKTDLHFERSSSRFSVTRASDNRWVWSGVSCKQLT